MNPPTEQLIRDYLNRLAIAARGRLALKDRQVLLDQTRARIEMECAGLSEVNPEQVRRALASLGDPVAVAEAEQARIFARARPGAVRAAEVLVGSPAGPAPGGTGLKAILPWVRPAGSTLSYLEAPVPAGALEPDDGPGDRASAGPGADDGPGAGDGPGADDGLEPGAQPAARFVPRQAASPEPESGQPAADAEDHGAAGEGALELYVDPRHKALGHADFRISAGPQDGGTDRAAWLRTASAAVSRWLVVVGGRLLTLARTQPLEMAAVILIGVGGAVFPPLWLLGALVALASRFWDIRDKWLGIALPVLAVVVGAALIIVFGGQRSSPGSYLSAAWVGAGRLFRLMAVAGASYLLWRLLRGRRNPRQPPWNVPRKFDL